MKKFKLYNFSWHAPKILNFLVAKKKEESTSFQHVSVIVKNLKPQASYILEQVYFSFHSCVQEKIKSSYSSLPQWVKA